MSSRAVDALRTYRAADSANKRQAVLEALAQAKDGTTRMTLSAVAERAGVSRQFIYSHPDLRAAVQAAERDHRPVVTTRQPARTELEQGLRADRQTLVAKVDRQRTTIAELRGRIADLEHQRRRWLGEQLIGRDAITPEELIELRLTINRLTSDKDTLTRSVEELRRINAILEAEVAASREAHAADVARYGQATGNNVTSISPRH